MKKSKLALVAMIIGILAVILEASLMFKQPESADAVVQAGDAIGKAIVFPSFISMVIAVILNAIGYFMNTRGFILAAAIVYIVALVLMPFWGFIGIPSMILCFVAFAKMKNQKQIQA